MAMQEDDDWRADYFECEPAPGLEDNPLMYADNNFPPWSRPHITQLQHFWSLCREYTHANALPLLDDNITFAQFVWSLTGWNHTACVQIARRHRAHYSVTAPIRFLETERSQQANTTETNNTVL